MLPDEAQVLQLSYNAIQDHTLMGYVSLKEPNKLTRLHYLSFVNAREHNIKFAIQPTMSYNQVYQTL